MSPTHPFYRELGIFLEVFFAVFIVDNFVQSLCVSMLRDLETE